MIIKVIIAITVQTTLSDKVHEHRIHEYQSNNSNHSSDKLSADKHKRGFMIIKVIIANIVQTSFADASSFRRVAGTNLILKH